MENTQSRILIAEDEPLIAMELEELVQELGCEAVGPAGDVPTALRLLADREFDAAVLDIKINGDTSFTIADELLRLGKPWIFTTGCDAEVLDGHYSDVPLVIKPFLREDVSALITEMVLGCSSQETKKNPVMPVR